MTNTCKAYLKEATWRRAKIVPTYDEYLENSIHSSGYLYIIVVCFMGMGKIATKEAFEWVNENSIAPKATCIMTRLLDDLADHKVYVYNLSPINFSLEPEILFRL